MDLTGLEPATSGFGTLAGPPQSKTPACDRRAPVTSPPQVWPDAAGTNRVRHGDSHCPIAAHAARTQADAPDARWLASRLLSIEDCQKIWYWFAAALARW